MGTPFKWPCKCQLGWYSERQEYCLLIEEVSKEQEQIDIKLRFKFFQDIQGELTPPDNFLPEYIKIVGVEINPVRKTIDRDYPDRC